MATTAPDDAATLYRLTSELIGTDYKPHVDTAISQGRAADRYYRYHVLVRKFPAPAHYNDPEHAVYGLYLWKGAILTLTNEDENGLCKEGAPYKVRLVHIFRFGRPGMTPEQLHGEKELPPPMLVEFPDRPTRADDAAVALGPRLLGSLPPDLEPSLLPKPAVSGPLGVRLASHLFAAWLAGVPLPPLEAAAPPAPAAAAPAAAAAGGGSSWMSGLLGLWNRVLGTKKPTAEETKEKEKKKEEEEKVAEGARGVVAEPAPPKLGLEEAWAALEQRVSGKDVVAEGHCSELERAWFELLSH
ncbi:hypothetical protein PLESTB_001080800 [Pleodorina starrii]|uniref:Uncharacterized protein n=1 Tax=Pleodorina starrii TaxID=330485 RepID=A0A9W6F4K0_9CHLO|nr:hypothetical protein PLESTM_001178200 [Pleodorina starrii]GLC56217.1 hypothetical protein PLESTB_001080800 [Pleodorina starrii]GLC69149.1 hypothetical protein PLESTF_000795300 [Pleodorina starrii]